MHARFEVEHQLQIFVMRTLGEQLDRFFHHGAHVEVGLLQAQLAGLDLGEVQDVVDDREQRVRRALDRVGETALPRVECRIEQQLGHAEDTVHRCADLMTHPRQKLALGATGVLGLSPRLLVLANGLAQFCIGRFEAVGALRDQRFQALPMRAQFRIAIFDLTDHRVETPQQRAKLIVSSRLDPCRVVALLRHAPHDGHQAVYRGRDMPKQSLKDKARQQQRCKTREQQHCPLQQQVIAQRREVRFQVDESGDRPVRVGQVIRTHGSQHLQPLEPDKTRRRESLA